MVGHTPGHYDLPLVRLPQVHRASPKGRAPSLISGSAASSAGLYRVHVSGKAQAGRKVGADVASFPPAELGARSALRGKAACLKSLGLGFAGRCCWALTRTLLEHASPSCLHWAQSFKARCHLKLTLRGCVGKGTHLISQEGKLRPSTLTTVLC